MQTKYIFITGGVVSGLGKGIAAASIGALLETRGLSISLMKLDPYINVDAGTMNPFQHGEVFVTEDGAETDLDLGHYERFSSAVLGRKHNTTTGQIYDAIIRKEREGEYLGATVQVVPHVIDEIKAQIEEASKGVDISIVEIGGTVGDIESLPFLEAIRQYRHDHGRENSLFVHLTLIVETTEMKTKPTQHSVKELRGLGITPDILVCRSTEPMTIDTKEKLAAFCHVSPDAVMSTHDVPNIYHVPLMLEQQGLCKILGIDCNKTGLLQEWKSMALDLDKLTENVSIAMVGKYTGLSDAYLSVIKSLQHAAMSVRRRLTINWIEASHLENEWKTNDEDEFSSAWADLKSSDGVLVPGGFGDRGIEGKILAANYARENKIPYLGICLGLQVATIEFCRNVLGMTGANSTEFNESVEYPAVVFMPEISKTHLGGTMRLGSRPTLWQVNDCKIKRLYGGGDLVNERHRHRYEVNPDIIEDIEASGLKFVGKDETGQRCEIFELDNHPYYVGVQYHPEFKSRPGRPSPPFLGLLMAAAKLE